MKADISVIVPIYKGQKYIPYWLDIVEKNASSLKALSLRCELIFVNDFPEEDIEISDQHDRGFTLKVLDSCENRGIHGARAYGLEHAEGYWVVFGDQDDKITDDYMVKQIGSIGDADGVICNGYIKYFCKNISNLIYRNSDGQEAARKLPHYLSTGNPIASPGQVMLKKDAIPDAWRQHILKMNGADDYFLWILMLKEGKRFALNSEKLYTHIGHGKNVSNDISAIARSVHEMDAILEADDLLDEKEKEIIRKRKIWGLDRPKSVEIIAIYDHWVYLEHRGVHVGDYLCMHDHHKIAIYGMSSLGDRLYDLLADSDIETVFAMDRRAKEFTCAIPVFCLEDEQVTEYMKQVDAVIVTAVSGFGSIKEEIESKHGITTLSLKNILVEMIEDME